MDFVNGICNLPRFFKLSIEVTFINISTDLLAMVYADDIVLRHQKCTLKNIYLFSYPKIIYALLPIIEKSILVLSNLLRFTGHNVYVYKFFYQVLQYRFRRILLSD